MSTDKSNPLFIQWIEEDLAPLVKRWSEEETQAKAESQGENPFPPSGGYYTRGGLPSLVMRGIKGMNP